jgi:hypothetical protein
MDAQEAEVDIASLNVKYTLCRAYWCSLFKYVLRSRQVCKKTVTHDLECAHQCKKQRELSMRSAVCISFPLQSMAISGVTERSECPSEDEDR